MNTTIKSLKRDVLLFFRSPREYLYSFSYPTNDHITISPYDPRITELGESYLRLIHEKYPLLETQFFGSAALKIAGQRDVDLVAVCRPAEFHLYIDGITTIMGHPKKMRRRFIEWEKDVDGCHIEFLLTDPNHKIYTEPHMTHLLLLSDTRHLREYEELKLSSNGISKREYRRRTLEFFNRIGVPS